MFTTYIIGIVLVISGTLLCQFQINQSSSLEERLQSLKWQKRVILVMASSSYESEFLAQKSNLETKKVGVEDRDLEILYISINNLNYMDKTFIRKKFEIHDQNFCIILIGKDGGEKRRSDEPLKADDLFQTIDAMPMRQQEAKGKNK
ncbi:DUF4174 domain-containing protein [Rhodocytophaga rosea]|uniref:DUF4174 domain-containing protein n=1 Tax=Rhodocytophaga rosea TaxID=2704465 RepID=A0A6C0GJB2_9BACT|nr:DUF4174 domain-containing protein [Rhodocytophaga rosea]QHT67894.1 DUF4174 domain-containing protein [Rhodocytophaga rosea]